jgi:hypothetical protein
LGFDQRLRQAFAQDFPELQPLLFNVRQRRRVRLIIPGQRFFDQPGSFGFQFGFPFGTAAGMAFLLAGMSPEYAPFSPPA